MASRTRALVQKLAALTTSRERWIVAVNMVSEGVDIPRLRVGVYATAAKTPLVFRQIVGRFVRTIPGRAVEPSWVYLPADPLLRAHAADVETELRHVLRAPGEEDPGMLDALDLRRETERTQALDFVPVAADVAPQMALFGAAPAEAPAAVIAPAAFPPAVAVEPELDGLPAYERRAILRDKRHRLVSELARRDRQSHAEVNGWLNRETGVRRVGEASLEQLGRSVELLLRALTRR